MVRAPAVDRWDFSVPLQLRLRPSWRLAGILLVAHGGAAICLLISALPAWLTWLAILPVAWHLWYALSQHAFRCARTAVIELRLRDEARIQLVTSGGQALEAMLLGGYSRPMFGVLRLRLGRWQRRTVVLLPDMAEPDRLSELRVRLRRLGQTNHSDRA